MSLDLDSERPDFKPTNEDGIMRLLFKLNVIAFEEISFYMEIEIDDNVVRT